jgi:translation initiation factor eIF-2B subunit alpha
MVENPFKIELNLDNKDTSTRTESNLSEMTLNCLTQSFKEFYQESIQNSEYSDNIDKQGNIIEAYISTLSQFIDQSQETTLQGLNIAIKRATEQLFRKLKDDELIPKGRSNLTLVAVSEIMIHLLNKHISKKIEKDFVTIKKNLVSITKDLHMVATYAKEKISNFFGWSIKNGMVILVHGYSNTIVHALSESKKLGLNFKVLVTEGRPENCGELMAKTLTDKGIDVKIILDSSIGYYVKDIDCIVVGADAVCENGGIINQIGTFTLAICAKNFKKPFYVMVECLKFLKIYPLDQSDIPKTENKYDAGNNLEYLYNYCDYTAPEFITLLFTDIGIFTPSAVSDELIQMFYN